MLQYVARVILPLLLFIYIAIESYFKLHHTSLCSATGCKLAGELLRFPSLYLNMVGLIGALLLLLLGILSLKKASFEPLFRVVSYSAVAFEATVLSYQLYANPQLCHFCLGVFGLLLLIALLQHLRTFYIPLMSVGAIIVAMGTLAIFHNQSIIEAQGNYLVFSNHCPHCKKVKAYLAKEKIAYTPISINNPSARFVLKFMGIETIPVWIEKSAKKRTLYIGDSAILSHLQPSSTTATPLSPSAMDTNFLSSGGDEGCSIAIDAPASCETNVSTP